MCIISHYSKNSFETKEKYRKLLCDISPQIWQIMLGKLHTNEENMRQHNSHSIEVSWKYYVWNIRKNDYGYEYLYLTFKISTASVEKERFGNFGTHRA